MVISYYYHNMNHILCFKRICGNLTTKTTTNDGGGGGGGGDIYARLEVDPADSLAMLDQQVSATPPLLPSRLLRLRSRLRRLRPPTPTTKLATKGVTTAPTSPSTTASPYYRGLIDFSLLSPLPPSPPPKEEISYHDTSQETTPQTSDDEDTESDTEASNEEEEKPSFEEITKFLLSSTKLNRRGSKSDLNWCPPSPGWVKLNVDGTVLENNSAMSGCGGLLRSETGQWLLGFSIRSDSTNVLEVELCALRMGLVLAWDQGHRNVCCETGCVRAHCLFQCSDSDDGVVMRSAEVDLLVKEIRRLLRRPWNVQLSHVFRSANTAAGYLAKLASKSAMDLQVWSSPPPGMEALLHSDITPHL
ncbi:hypothetical protein PIB30_117677 [Stylosanthes scabra]|uniref:RNase H type-1 domain-containing protein n=1 Tax=Stylosanthes scabra TaxID=79078 RepID=A0ABU6W328_9FABA|nr:hypothetical protein [Stylosanthes scabra]